MSQPHGNKQINVFTIKTVTWGLLPWMVRLCVFCLRCMLNKDSSLKPFQEIFSTRQELAMLYNYRTWAALNKRLDLLMSYLEHLNVKTLVYFSLKCCDVLHDWSTLFIETGGDSSKWEHFPSSSLYLLSLLSIYTLPCPPSILLNISHKCILSTKNHEFRALLGPQSK